MSRSAKIFVFFVVSFAFGAFYLIQTASKNMVWNSEYFFSRIIGSSSVKNRFMTQEHTMTTSLTISSLIPTSAIPTSALPTTTTPTSTIPTTPIPSSTIPTSTNSEFISGSSNVTTINMFRIQFTAGVKSNITDNPFSSMRLSTSKKNNYFDSIPEQLYRVSEVNCGALFQGDTQSLNDAQENKTTVGTVLTDEYYMNATTDCDAFQLSRGYIMSYLTEDERQFPIAYSLVVYKDSEMVERILRAIYRPQNYYCIHIDLSANVNFYNAMAAIAQCFLNVFLSTKRVDVKWGEFSVLESELVCMKELWRYRKWKYFINLTGQEFPLKTNFELVKILEAFKGANNINGTLKFAYPHRWRNKTPPYGIRPLKGSVHITANRDYVDYVLHNETAGALLAWTNETIIPDETFFSTLNFNPQLGVKGSFKGDPDSVGTFISRYKVRDLTAHLCAGHFVRQICILGLGDLPRLGAAVEMFANKFFLSEDRVVIVCLEEKLFNDTRGEYLGVQQFNDTRGEYLGVQQFNASFYGDLNSVTDQVT